MTGEIEIRAPELEAIPGRMTALEQTVRSLEHKIRPPKPWYTREEAAALKGVSVSTLDKPKNRYLWPNFGVAHTYGGGKRGWHWSEIEPWLAKDDETLEREYQMAKRGAA